MKSLRLSYSVAGIAFNRLSKLGSEEILSLILETNFHRNSYNPLITQEDENVVYKKEQTVVPIEKELRNASVSVLLYHDCGNDSLSFVIGLKESRDNSTYKHAGTMVFPGGILLDYETPLRGCIRETHEEVLFSTKKGDSVLSDEKDWYIQIINEIPKIHVNKTNIDVYPFIGVVENTQSSRGKILEDNNIDMECVEREILELIVKDEKELSQMFLVDLKDLMMSYDPKGVSETEDVIETGPTFQIEGYPQIWGISSRIIAYLFHCMEDRLKKEPTT